MMKLLVPGFGILKTITKTIAIIEKAIKTK